MKELISWLKGRGFGPVIFVITAVLFMGIVILLFNGRNTGSESRIIVIENNGKTASIVFNNEEKFILTDADIPRISRSGVGRIYVNYQKSRGDSSSSMSNSIENLSVSLSNGKLFVNGVDVEKLLQEKRRE